MEVIEINNRENGEEVPEGWEIKALGDVVDKIIGGGTPSRSNRKYWGREIPWVTVKDFATFNPYTSQEYITKIGLENSASNLIPKNTLITSTRMGLGKAVIYKVDVSINQDLKALFPSKNITTEFLYHWFKKNAEIIEKLGNGSTVLGISLNELKGIQFIQPPKEEQAVIATALSDTDALISSMEKLIAKKREIKQGAMQELLKPKKGWEVKKLGEIGTIIRGASPRPQGDKRYYGGSVPRLMVEDVTRDGKYVTPKVDFLTDEGAKKSRPCRKGTLTIVCSGTVGVVSILAVDACIHDGFLALIDIKSNYSTDYLYHKLSTLRKQFDNSATHGGIFTNLTTASIREFETAFPLKGEQVQIASILSDMDAEIINLESKLIKYHQIKSGMMQSLLTGKIRLV